MTKNLDQEGLNSIAGNYGLFYIDLWGVVHNGILLHKEAVNVLNQLQNLNKEFILLTNAPRPSETVRVFLKKMGLNENILSHVYSSGEAALDYLSNNLSSEKFYHIGPPRDFDLFKAFRGKKTDDINDCDYFLCTGLINEQNDDLNYYKKLFEKKTKKKNDLHKS